MAVVIKEPIKFIWDKGNKDKSWLKHKATNSESEEIFFDANKKISKDKFHSGKEERFIVLGRTRKERLLFVVFTVRGEKVRVISARDVNRKERRLYEKTT